MRFISLKFIAVLVITSLACQLSLDLPVTRPGDTQTVTLNENVDTDDTARVMIGMGGGTLNISGGGQSLVDGTIAYNLAEWEPIVERSSSAVRIQQEIRTIPIPQTGQSMLNQWDLRLGSTPMELEINAGAHDGTLDLSGVPLRRFDFTGGASNTTIRFDTPNPERMDILDFRTGASNIQIIGLGNANVDQMAFTGAAGDYTLDFSGEAQADSLVEISGAVGNMTIIVMSGQAVQINLTGGLRDVQTEGNWQTGEDVYTIAGSGPNLTINVEMNVGRLNLIAR
jgi:hypothetical protein